VWVILEGESVDSREIRVDVGALRTVYVSEVIGKWVLRVLSLLTR
jgi:hypothetical protein